MGRRPGDAAAPDLGRHRGAFGGGGRKTTESRWRPLSRTGVNGKLAAVWGWGLHSLHGRLLLASVLVLAGFLGVAGVALDQAFRRSAEAGLRERLMGHVYALLAAADEDSRGRMVLPQTLPDPRFSKPDSGLYARVDGEDGYRWRSPSLAGRGGDFLRPQPPGVRRYFRVREAGEPLYVVNYGVAWEDAAGQSIRYTLAVAQDFTPVAAEMAAFRGNLWRWLGGLALALLVVQGLIVRWGLGPLRRVERDLERIEAGAAESLAGDYPRELQGLTRNLNALIASSRASRERYRNRLGDLAHSMKTPLAILRNAAESGSDDARLRPLVLEQVARMDEIVQHQLRRAAAAPQSTLGRAVEVRPVMERIARSLARIHAARPVDIALDVPSGVGFFGDEGDLMEILGNLLDNACKYGRGRVRAGARAQGLGRRPGLLLWVEDDGPGIEPGKRREVLRRGSRLDQRQPGQGIGLSVVREIVEGAGGRIHILDSPLGGARVEVRIPPPGLAQF